MARPSPRAVVRFSEKIETSVNDRHHLQHGEGADDGEDPDGQRQQGRHHAAEHHDEQQQRDRQGDHLGPLQVGLHPVADGVVHDGRAAGRDGEGALVALDGVGDLDGAVGHGVVVARQPHQHERGVAVGALERRWAAERPVRRGLQRRRARPPVGP